MRKISFDIPDSIDEQIRRVIPNLDDAAKEAFLVDLYRQGRLFHSEFANALGIPRYDADGVLQRHGVVDELTVEDLNEQIRTLDHLLRT
jgi:hypothetical protein